MNDKQKAKVTKQLKPLLSAGGFLSNVAFNLKESDDIPKEARMLLERFQKEWDKARKELPKWMKG